MPRFVREAPSSPAAGWIRLAKQVKGGHSVVVDNAGNYPQIEQLSAINELLLDFLGKFSDS
ncbi:alpha/beta fold hydrolase [Mycobacterium leprae]|uniref:alpha/beta fold hydrolase n=1 Tax=Mycobacterium leprae TaxID=1769 RepID=UPI0002DADF67|nr:hypothetical protein [Mycobacterium leprae]